MKLKIFASLILTVLGASASAADYEVTIDGRAYLFSKGVEQEVVLEDGQRISISIKGVKAREFHEHGLSFSYPAEMKLDQESYYGVKQVTLESIDSTLLMIQVFPAGITPAELQQDLLAGFREEFSNLGARFPAEPTAPCKRFIGGVERAIVARCDVQKPDYTPDDIFAVLRQDILPQLGFRPIEGDPMTFLGETGTPSEGVKATFTGENEERDKNFRYLQGCMLIAVVLIFGILVLQFNSFRQATLVLLTVPLSFIGVVAGMW